MRGVIGHDGHEHDEAANHSDLPRRRSYDTLDTDPGEQAVVLQSRATGRVRGIAVGNGQPVDVM